MGGAVSRLPGKRGVQAAIDKAGLPLQVDGDGDDSQEKGPPPPPTITEPYDSDGWFTGVRSTVIIKKSSSAVYSSLKTDLHKVFTPMTECHDEVREEDEAGAQKIFRIVRIPFKVAFVSGNLKMRLNVEQSPKTGEIHFDNVKEGALISNFVALFKISPPPAEAGDSQESTVTLDTKIAVKRLPPPPFKGLVKGVMINKIDSCMVDLVNFHGGEAMSRKMSRRRSSMAKSRRSSMQTARSAAMSQRASMESLPEKHVAEAPSPGKSGPELSSVESAAQAVTSSKSADSA